MDCQLCGGTGHGADGCSMRETALMDVLQGVRTAPAKGEWAPSAEKVLNHEELAPPDAPPATGRPAGFGPPRSPAGGGRPELSAADLEALEDLTYAELARVRGLDPDAIERVGRLGRAGGGPDAAPETVRVDRFHPVPARVRAPLPAHAPGGETLPTWPPAGEVAIWSPTTRSAKSLGPVRSRHRPHPRGRSGRAGRIVAATTLVAALAGAAVGWFVVHRPAGPAHWDPRAAPIAAFVAQQTARPWKHPVAVSFLPAPAFAARFGSAVPPPPGPAGAAVARFDPRQHTVYVNGPVLDVYRKVALAGQLGQALESQYSVPAALAEGGAAAAQAAYIRALPVVQLQSYQREARAGG